MSNRYAVFDPVDEQFEFFKTRQSAEFHARALFDSIASVASDEGWPERMDEMAVYECKPVLLAREVDGRSREACPETREDHDECETCEGAGAVDDLHGDPWPSHDYDFICDYKLTEPAEIAAALTPPP